MSPTAAIWNRACGEVGGPTTLTAAGDRALADLVLGHSTAINGGLLHAVESLTEVECAAAVAGFRYFGLDEAATVFQDVFDTASGGMDDEPAEQLEVEADTRYWAVVADDDVLVSAFVNRYRREPSAFDAP